MDFKRNISSFVKGVGPLFDFAPRIQLEDFFSYYNVKTPKEKDALALASDWKQVGKDLEYAIKKIKSEIEPYGN
mgnify:CR=1 FL=1